MLLGLRTAIYHTPDIEAGKRWYTRVLDCAPYFDQPFYVGFNVGGFELGLSPDGGPEDRCSVGAYWGVKDIATAHARLLELAKEWLPDCNIRDRIGIDTPSGARGGVFPCEAL